MRGPQLEKYFFISSKTKLKTTNEPLCFYSIGCNLQHKIHVIKQTFYFGARKSLFSLIQFLFNF